MNGKKSDPEKRMANRLISEKSPYLQQHSYNPVHWHPWDDVAIGQAVAENKPVLLSIGYSACHWCHVMEKESFENVQTAEIMNRHFVNIKVDREERPDLDAIYMSAVSAMTGRGGWPLNVFLTPDLKPFFGGTYFPVDDRFGMMSWTSVLLRIAGLWKDPAGHEKIRETAEDLTRRLNHHLSETKSSFTELPGDAWTLPDLAFAHYASLFDEKYGGFGPAPKFPSPVTQNFLLAYGRSKQTPDHERALKMALNTLKAMAKGGIYDHLGGGFHRYSTDSRWHVPHFEKMLYDNAQLLINYTDAFVLSGEELFGRIAKETADYLIRDMRDEHGGFYSAEDADSLPYYIDEDQGHSEKKEGAFYVWGKNEFEEIIGRGSLDFEVAAFYFGIKLHGNVENDPGGEFENKNILYEAHSMEKVAERFSLPLNEAFSLIQKVKGKLWVERKKRSSPGLDDKIITSWNGLAISALSKACQVFDEKKYLHAAREAAEFLWKNLYDPPTTTLFRRWKAGEKKVKGLCEDYAFLVQGLLDLFEADSNPIWLDRALELTEKQTQSFFDQSNAGFFMTGEGHDRNLIIRVKDENDSVIPGANSVSVMNFIRLGKISGRDALEKIAHQTTSVFYEKMKQFPGSMPQMLVALQRLERGKG
jgi:hypothetical protein